VTDFIAFARTTLDHLKSGQFAAVHRQFTDQLAQALPPDKLKAQWEELITYLGAFKEVVDSQHMQLDGAEVVALLLQFERAQWVLRIHVKDGVVIGMHTFPPAGNRPQGEVQK
jgi:hypothetical protein